MNRSLAILGCGPAGLLTAHAAFLAGDQPYIFSDRIKPSVISGAQYLHDPIDDITSDDPDGILRYIKLGDMPGYADKVYGNTEAPCSWNKFPEGELPAWSMEVMYERLWSRYASMVVEQHIDAEVLMGMVPQFNMVISAIPLTALCHRPHHNFHSTRILIEDGCPALVGNEDNIIVYSGDPVHRWYRTSRIFGHESTEYAGWAIPNPGESGVYRTGIKPTWTTCNCWQDVHRVGRFGQWKKGVLVHHAFNEAQQLLTKGSQ